LPRRNQATKNGSFRYLHGCAVTITHHSHIRTKSLKVSDKRIWRILFGEMSQWIDFAKGLMSKTWKCSKDYIGLQLTTHRWCHLFHTQTG